MRKADARITYNGTNITTDLKPYLLGLSYTDCASGESDSIEIKLEDRSGLWMDHWFPDKGDKISLDFVASDWNTTGEQKLPCGSFTVDNLRYSGRPLQCDIGALSIPANDGFNITTKTKTWKGMTVKQMAEEIAHAASVTCFYDAEEILIEEIEQSAETDCSFLYSVCEKYGISMKVHADKICLFDIGNYEAVDPTLVITENDMESWRYETTTYGTYTGARISYTHPKTEEDYIVQIGGGSRILEINEKVDNVADAERKAIAMVNQANRKSETLTIVLPGNIALSSSMTVSIRGLKRLDGKYYIDKVKHTLDNGYRVNLELHKVQERIPSIINTNQSQGTQYTIKKGDTLWGIAKQFLGSGLQWSVIYELNKDIIESAAIHKGKVNSNSGHWIYPGTVIIIPT